MFGGRGAGLERPLRLCQQGLILLLR
jgi:hypothetical protein